MQDVGAAIDFERRVIAPLIGIADLDGEGGELLERFLSGFFVHPCGGLDAVGQRFLEIVHHFERAFLGFGREIIGDVKFAERFTEFFIRRGHDAFPARLELLRPGQGFADRSRSSH